MPTINNDKRTTDFFVLEVRKEKDIWKVNFNGEWLNIKATVHTHQYGDVPYGTDFIPVRLGMGPSIIIGPGPIWAAFRDKDGKEAISKILTNSQLLVEGYSIIDNLSKIPNYK